MQERIQYKKIESSLIWTKHSTRADRVPFLNVWQDSSVCLGNWWADISKAETERVIN